MNANNLHDALNQLDDKLIEEVDKLRAKPKSRRRLWRRGLAAVACLCIIAVSVLAVNELRPVTPDSDPRPTTSQIENRPANADAPTVDLMEGISAATVTTTDDLTAGNAALTDFAVRLFKASEESGKNTLISPLSVVSALAMTANGAKQNTLAQMEQVLGLPTDILNSYLYSYMQTLPQNEKTKLSLANSIWFTADDSFTADWDFLQKNADYYGADLYKAPFNQSTVADINDWVKAKTDGMIPEIIDNLSPDAVMCLVNALAFEAEWLTPYTENQVHEGTFTHEDGTVQRVEFMHSFEYTYLEDDNAIGFIKPYSNPKYAFVALLPNVGTSVSDYVASLDGATLRAMLDAMLSSPQSTHVVAALPKFETEYSTDMSAILADMGMRDAFSVKKADFSSLGSSTKGNIFINRVVHKTFISVAEQGTKAGAATVIDMAAGSNTNPEPKTVTLDRPFVYMLIDCETNVPFFLCTVMDVNG